MRTMRFYRYRLRKLFMSSDPEDFTKVALLTIGGSLFIVGVALWCI